MVNGKFATDGNTADGDCHCWVEVRGKIVDITATQFDVLPEVYIVSENSKKYSKERVIKSYRDLSGWRNQRPSRECTKKILEIAA